MENFEKENLDLGEIKSQNPNEKKQKYIKIAVISICSIIAFIIFCVTLSNIISENNAKKRYIAKAKEAFAEIEEEFNDNNYSSVMLELKDYKKRYSENESKYYKKLPKKLRAEVVCEEYENKVAEELYNDYTTLKKRFENKENIEKSEYENVKRFTDCMKNIINLFPDGLTYKNSKIEVNDSLEQYYFKMRLTENILLYNNDKKSQALSGLKKLSEEDKLKGDLRSEVNEVLQLCISANPARSFKITGGSKGVYILSSGRNYGFKCPNCGYDKGPLGTIDSDFYPSGHYSGETVTLTRMFICASRIRGGCYQDFRYQLTVEFE